MKSKSLNEFWDWFAANAAAISSEERPELLNQLDGKLRELDPQLSWEIGPGRVEPWLFSISPNLDKELVSIAKSVVNAAPEIPDWEIYAARQPKQWDYRVALETEGSDRPIHLDASTWQFVLLRYPDGTREVLLTGPSLPPLNDDQRWQVAAIVLEGILGEETLLERIDEFELIPAMEPRFADRLRPIGLLKAAVA